MDTTKQIFSKMHNLFLSSLQNENSTNTAIPTPTRNEKRNKGTIGDLHANTKTNDSEERTRNKNTNATIFD